MKFRFLKSAIVMTIVLVSASVCVGEEVQNFEEFRMGHLVRTAEVWKKIQELGVTEETEVSFEFFFEASSKVAADAVVEELSSYPLKVEKKGFLKKTWHLSGESGPIKWTEEQLLKWVDYLIAVGSDAGASFDGCGALVP